MKKLTKLLTVLLTVSLLASLIPAVSLFAEEEINNLPVQTEQIVYEEAETQAAAEETASEDAGNIPESEETMPEEPEQEKGEPSEGSEEKADEEAGLSDLNKLEPSVTILAAVSEEKMGAGTDEKEEAEDGRIDLSITNITRMFNAVTAYLLSKDGKTELVVALNGTGYHELFVGTYEQAVANGANTNNWIHGAVNTDGKWEFRIPVSSGESYIPIVAISDSYYSKYLNGENTIERAFFPRQFSLDIANKTLTTNDYVKNQELEIVNNVTMFSPSNAVLNYIGGPNSNTFVANLVLTMGSTSFGQVCYGPKDKVDSAVKYDAEGGNTFTIPVKWAEKDKPETMQSVIGTTVVMSFYSVKKDEWYERKMTINEEAGTITFDEVKDEEDPSGGGDTPVPTPTPTPPAPAPDGGGDDGGTPDSGGGNTAAVDNSTGLADGIYKPDRFAFSGGSGRIIITCDQVEVIGGKAYATIRFQNIRSGSTEMNYVKASGGKFNCTQDGGSSVVRIPVELNKNNQILALTTKMSAAHEIAYTIFIYIAGADAKKSSTLTENKELDKEAPVIAGLEYQGEEAVEKAEFFKIFNYSDGVRLLEIDMRLKENDPNNKDAKKEKDKDAASDAKEEKAEDDTVIDEETGEEVAVLASKAEAQAKLYKGNIIKYLIVPENVEIPAGLDKETIVIQLPLKSIYSGADAISGIFEKLAIKDRIKSQPKEDKDNKEIVAAGEFKDLDLKKLIKSKCDLILLPEDCVKDKKARETFEEMTEDLANLDIPVLVDRSEYEESDEAKAEWLKIYGILFGCEDAANAAVQAAKK